MFEKLLFNLEELPDDGLYPTTIGMFHGGLNSSTSLCRINDSLTVLTNTTVSHSGFQHSGARCGVNALFYGGRDNSDTLVSTLRFHNFNGTLNTATSAPNLNLQAAASDINDIAMFYASNDAGAGRYRLLRVSKNPNIVSQATNINSTHQKIFATAATVDNLMLNYGSADNTTRARTVVALAETGSSFLTAAAVGTAGYDIGAVGFGDVGVWWGGTNRSTVTTRINGALTLVSAETVASPPGTQQRTARVGNLGLILKSNVAHAINKDGVNVLAETTLVYNAYSGASCGL